jgi:hypothetical protein
LVASYNWQKAPGNQRLQDLSGGEIEMRKGGQTRHEIIRKAAAIFNQRGPEGAALSFESKQQPADETFDYAWKIGMDTRFAGTEAISNAVDRLMPGGCLAAARCIDADDGNPQGRKCSIRLERPRLASSIR